MSCSTLRKMGLDKKSSVLLNPKLQPTTGNMIEYFERRFGTRYCWIIDVFKKRFYHSNRIFSPSFNFTDINWQIILHTSTEKVSITLWGKTKYNRVITYEKRLQINYKIYFIDKDGKLHREFEGTGEFFGKYVSLAKHDFDITSLLLNYSQKSSFYIRVKMSKKKITKRW